MRTYLANITGAALLIGSLYAQKPTGGTITGEVALNGAINNINIGLVQGARVRYFLGDNLAVRVGLDIQTRSKTDKVYENRDGTGGVGTEVNKSSYFGLLPGVEYHFTGGERLSTFAGGYLLLGVSGASTTSTNYFGGAYTANYSQTVSGSAFGGNARKGTSIGLGLYSGFDWYFVENLYLGIEWGLLFSSTTESDVVTETSAGGTTTKIIQAGGKRSGINIQSIGALRLGYQF